jgi:GNAT superfamily N-acetyltransferase
MKPTATVRELSPHDDMTLLTKLIHAAYAKRAARNLRYWATHQTVADTVKRMGSGHGMIAEIAGEIVGTLTVRPPQASSEVPIYRIPNTWTLSQFAVLPTHHGFGIGRQLHDAAVAYALSHGGQTMALDTAAPATELIDMYIRWGYAVIGECDWRPHTNYKSVLMAASITALGVNRNVP